MDTSGGIHMKYETSELVFILDRSGSISGLEKDTIGGFNSLIQKQRNLLKTTMNIIDLELQERIERINLYLALGAPDFEKVVG